MRFPTFLILSTSLLLFTGCGTKTPEDNTAKTTTPEQAAQTAVDQAKSATEKATSTAQTELDKAKSATEQPTSTANATLDKAKSATELATNQAQSKMNEMKSAVDKAKQSTTKAVQGAIALKDGVQGMSSGVTNTLAAVKAGDLNTAKQEFTKLQGDWTTIEGAVKTKSAKAYEEINGHMTILGKLFKSGKPDANAAQLTTELQALGKSLTTSLIQK
jgi:hypothetical protein